MNEGDGDLDELALNLGQVLEPDRPEWADCVLTERQLFRGRCGGILDGAPQEEEEF